MRPYWRRIGIPGLVGLGVLTAGAFRAEAHWFRDRGAVVATEYIAVAPTAYVLPTAYVVPTTFLSTSYAVVETDFFVPTVFASPSYAATSYVVPTSAAYVFPTSYYQPTSWFETAYEILPTTVAVAADACATTEIVSPAVVSPEVTYASPSASSPQVPAPGGTPPATPKTPGGSVPSTVKPPPALESETIPDEAPDAGVKPPTQTRDTAPPSGGAAQPRPEGAGELSPPAAPAPDNEMPAPAGITPIEPETGAKPPVAPGDEPAPVELPRVEDLGASKREVRRPVMPALSRPTLAARYLREGTALGVLEGKVVSGETGRPEPGVQVTLTNRARTFVDRVITTDPSGHYAVRLPDGDWTVKVSMPSGRVYSVSQLTVSQGQIIDDLGRDIPTLNITR